MVLLKHVVSVICWNFYSFDCCHSLGDDDDSMLFPVVAVVVVIATMFESSLDALMMTTVDDDDFSCQFFDGYHSNLMFFRRVFCPFDGVNSNLFFCSSGVLYYYFHFLVLFLQFGGLQLLIHRFHHRSQEVHF